MGRGACIDVGVTLGDDCKVQNHAPIYQPSVVGNGVFVGPAVGFTNVRYPRAVTPHGIRKSSSDWAPGCVSCLEGTSIGARAVCVASVAVGRWEMSPPVR